MPFGLKNAPATFQRLMDHVLAGLQGAELFVYLDDIVLYASSLREHEIKFERLAARLRNANLKLQPDKCEFLRKEVTYLGHIIGKNGVKPDPKKVEAVREFPRPLIRNNQKTIKQFLGLAGYYRRFIPNFSKIAKPLTDLLKKESAFVWTEKRTEAFTSLRDALCSQPLLPKPGIDRQRFAYSLHIKATKQRRTELFNDRARVISNSLQRQLLPTVPLRPQIPAHDRPQAARLAELRKRSFIKARSVETETRRVRLRNDIQTWKD